jgi:hypothetical protein
MLVHLSFCTVWFLSNMKRNSKSIENCFGKFKKEKEKKILFSPSLSFFLGLLGFAPACGPVAGLLKEPGSLSPLSWLQPVAPPRPSSSSSLPHLDAGPS